MASRSCSSVAYYVNGRKIEPMRTLAKRPSRWKQFSLRTLLLFMSVCCVLMGVWAVYIQPYRDQAVAYDMVTRLGGNTVTKPGEGSRWHQWLVITFLGRKRFIRIVAVDLSSKQVDDEVLEGLIHLVFLERLVLDRTPITDESVAALERFDQLEELSLRYTSITDSSAESLSKLGGLRTLYLTGTRMSDEAIPHFRQLGALQEVFLRWTDITNQGAAQLTSTLPHCVVHHHALQTSAVRNTR